MGALVGIAMLPVLYAFGKRLFHKTEYAFLCTALFAFDFMHFTQTRIATIDVYRRVLHPADVLLYVSVHHDEFLCGTS